MKNDLIKAQRDYDAHVDRVHSHLIVAMVTVSVFSIVSWIFLVWKILTIKLG